MAKRGYFLAVSGLVLGLALGIVILLAERKIAGLLIELLSDEAFGACQGSIKADSVKVSLLRLSAVAKRPRLEVSGEAALEFAEAKASFSLSQLGKRKIVLSNLQLIDGISRGVGPDSPTFKFIDFLTEPIPPERDHPGRWKIVLQALQVINSTIIEELKFGQLLARQAFLSVQRDRLDNFVLRPFINEVVLLKAGSSETTPLAWQIGQAEGELYIEDDGITFRDLRIKKENSSIRLNAKSIADSDHSISGQVEFDLTSKFFGLSEDWQFQFTGEADLAGTLADPKIRGKVALPQRQVASFTVNDQLSYSLDRFETDFLFDYNDGEALVELYQLQAAGSGLLLESTEQILISEQKLAGRLRLTGQELFLKPLTLIELISDFKLDGSLNEPVFHSSGMLGGILFQDYLTPALGFSIDSTNGAIDFSLFHQSPQLGTASAQGALVLTEDTPQLSNVTFELQQLHLMPTQDLIAREGLLESLRLTGHGTIDGPVNPKLLKAKADLTVSSQHFAGEAALQGHASLEDGELNLDISNETQSLSLAIDSNLTDLREGQLVIKLNNFKPEEYLPKLECILIDLDLNYQFSLDNPYAGNGQLALNNIAFGCQPVQVSLEQPYQLKIRQGTLTLPGVALQSLEGRLVLQGEISTQKGYQIRSDGTINLAPLANFLPTIDDLRGILQTTVNITGPLNQPLARGEASIKNAELAIESANLSATGISGSAVISQDIISLDRLVGAVNGGDFSLSGDILLKTPALSVLNLTLRGVLLEPNPDTIAEFSGDLMLSRSPAGRPTIEGDLQVESAEFRKNIDLLSLLRAATTRAIARDVLDNDLTVLPEIDLNIRLRATRNLFVLTNWLGGELRGGLVISGSLSNPVIEGELETVVGWFGLRDRRFSITTGRIIFAPNQREPRLEILGESSIFTRGGDSAMVLVEITGPLTDPQVSLSSDIGLPQREILGLITAGGALSGRTLVNVVAHNFELDEPSLFEELASLEWRRFLRGLTRIDSLTVVPRYNVQTGLIEPAFLAEKRLTPRLSAIGESFLGREVNQGKLGLLYKVTPSLNVIAAAENYAPRGETSLSLDLIKTILATQIPFVEISFRGNETYRESELLRGLFLTTDSRIPRGEIPRLQRELTAFYNARGFRAVKVDAICLDDQTYCRQISFNIQEGPRTLIRAVITEGDYPADRLNKEELQRNSKRPASEILLERTRRSVQEQLRRQGFLGARVTAAYIESPEQDRVDLLLTIFSGRMIEFSFTGNQRFDSEELLETINLRRRRQPFGSNTINILVENIERRYREAGYLFATVSFNRLEPTDSSTIRYEIKITEEQIVPVAQVVLIGNKALDENRLRQLTSQYFPTIRDNIFFPRFAVAEQLERNIAILRSLYIEEGFPEATVKFDIKPDPAGKSVTINYLISEGPQLTGEWLIITGLPEDFVRPALPAGPYSIPRANGYIETLLDLLKAQGYLQAAFSSDFQQDQNHLTIEIDPGPRTHVVGVEFQGNLAISNETIGNLLEIRPGDPWVREKLHASRRRLLRSGLFSRVELEPAGGKLEQLQEVLLVRVTERPLQTLEVGIGQNTSLGGRFFLEAIDKALFRDGRSLALRSDLYYQPNTNEITQGIASLRYTDPSFLDSDLSLSEDLRYQKIDTSTLPYNLDRFSLASYLFEPGSNHWDWTAGHTILQEDLSKVSPDVILSDLDQNVVTLSFLSGSLTLDKRDDPLVPRRGYLLSTNCKLAAEPLGSDANFYAFGTRATALAPFSVTTHHFVLAFNSQAALAQTFNDTSAIPISQRYFLGGGSSIRGFAENSLGPQGDDGNPIGGDFLFANNLELRYAVTDTLWAQSFIDAGNVFLIDDTVALNDIRVSSGIGIRFVSPIGPIGLDLARPIDRQAGERELRLHFSIGTNF